MSQPEVSKKEDDVSVVEEVPEKKSSEETETPEESGEELGESDVDSSSDHQNGVAKNGNDLVENGADKKDEAEAEACPLPQKRKSEVVTEDQKDGNEAAEKKLKKQEAEESNEAESTA